MAPWDVKDPRPAPERRYRRWAGHECLAARDEPLERPRSKSPAPRSKSPPPCGRSRSPPRPEAVPGPAPVPPAAPFGVPAAVPAPKPVATQVPSAPWAAGTGVQAAHDTWRPAFDPWSEPPPAHDPWNDAAPQPNGPWQPAYQAPPRREPQPNGHGPCQQPNGPWESQASASQPPTYPKERPPVWPTPAPTTLGPNCVAACWMHLMQGRLVIKDDQDMIKDDQRFRRNTPYHLYITYGVTSP